MSVPQTQTVSGAPAVVKPKSDSGPGKGNWRQRLRLWSGLILFAFCVSHFLNHSLGMISVSAMEKGSLWHYWVWRNPVVESLLLLAAFTHVCLALWRTAKRSTLKIPPWEFAQLVLGLYIPWTLIPHVTVTMGLAKNFGFIPSYHQMLTILWPDHAFTQIVLLLVVWIHAMIGLHFWLRLYHWYRRFKFLALAFAIAMPVTAIWGFVEGARRLALAKDVNIKVTPEQMDWAYEATIQLRAIVFGLIAISLFVILFRYLVNLSSRRLTITYPGGLSVKAKPGATLLEISRMNDVPIASVCGGRARCSTCRVKVLDGADLLDDPAKPESAVLGRISAGDNVRLACQIRPQKNLEVQPLVPVKASATTRESVKDAYYWGVEQDVVVMFVDLRNFTKITEAQLAYDVVHLLNSYLDQSAAAIRAEGGYVDKFIGDGIMAIFGMDTGVKNGARQALRASKRIEEVMQSLDAEKGPQFRDPIRLGIGLHVGSAILGRIGSTGSSGGLTALGDVVNTASRLEAENKNHGSFLAVSKDVVDAAEAVVTDAETSEIRLRGKEIPLQILLLKGLDTVQIPDGDATTDA